MILTGLSPDGLPSKKWLKPRMNRRRGAACVRVMLPSMLLLLTTSSTAFLSGVNDMPSSAKDTVVRKTPCKIAQGDMCTSTQLVPMFAKPSGFAQDRCDRKPGDCHELC